MVLPRPSAAAITRQLQQRFVSLWLARSSLPFCRTIATRRPLQILRTNNIHLHGVTARLFSNESTATATIPATPTTPRSISNSQSGLTTTVIESTTTDSIKRLRKRPKLDWTPEADTLLLELRTIHNKKWLEIGQQLGREPATCMSRFESTLNPILKDFWTAERDKELESLVTSSKSWPEISQILGMHRLACMERWRQMGLMGPMDSAEVDSSAEKATEARHKRKERERRRQQQKLDAQLVQQRADSQEQLRNIREMASSLKSVQQVDKDQDRLSWNSLLKDEQRYSHYRSWKKKTKLDAFSQLYLMNPGWSAKEETVLIQFVQKHGLDKWDVAATEVLKGRFTAAECRTCWKNLDMPVVSSAMHEDKPSSQAEISRSSGDVALGEENRADQERIQVLARTFTEDFKPPPRNLSFSDGDSGDIVDMALAGNGDQSTAEVAAASKTSKSQSFVWDKELSVRLQAVIRQTYKSRVIHLDEINWAWVSRRVHPNATSRICKNHWKFLHDTSNRVVWTHEDIKKLEEGVRLLGPRKLTQIRDHFLPHMTKDEIVRHWFRISDKATAINENEYYRLLGAVNEVMGDATSAAPGDESRHGSENEATVENGNDNSLQLEDPQSPHWIKVEKMMGPGWKKMPCKRVWESSFQYLIQHGNWTSNEDIRLLRMVKFVGRDDWYSVAKAMQSGKSPWQYHLRWCQLLDPVDLDTSDLFVNGEKYC